jgi:hypothetical protein
LIASSSSQQLPIAPVPFQEALLQPSLHKPLRRNPLDPHTPLSAAAANRRARRRAVLTFAALAEESAPVLAAAAERKRWNKRVEDLVDRLRQMLRDPPPNKIRRQSRFRRFKQECVRLGVYTMVLARALTEPNPPSSN